MAGLPVDALVVNRIRRLPPALANQIAAGEVVERPASVVKELVENAVDAGATRLSIVVEFGGKKLIRSRTTGKGCRARTRSWRSSVTRRARSRRRLTWPRFAHWAFAVRRLPSIASVSRFRLRTRLRGTISGTEIRVEAGLVQSVREVGAPEGTLVEVAELFYNLPARRKFLKADTAETAQVSRLVTQLALGYREVGFALRSGERLLLEAPPAGSLDERFYQIYGERADLVRVQKVAAGIGVTGFVAALGEQGPVRGPQHVFVNRRMVRDRTITHAIQQAYSVATIKERSPEVHLFLDVPADRVDVNVHPTKAEVRFLDQGLVHEILRRAVIDALGATTAPELVLSPAEPTFAVQTPALPLGFGPMAAPAEGMQPARGSAEGGPVGTDERGSVSYAATPTAPWTPVPAATTAGRESVASLIQPMVPLGQFRNTFIIAVDADGLAIIDQHVAHERILFEQISERLTTRTLESQRLLTPVVLDLGPGEHQTLVSFRGDLERFGFDVEDFGGTSVRVSAVPALLEWTKCEEALRAVASDLDGLTPAAGLNEALRRMAATMACHAAVKANDPLTREKMQYLLDELRRTAHSSVCPHGRPVVLRLTRREIEKNFERI